MLPDADSQEGVLLWNEITVLKIIDKCFGIVLNDILGKQIYKPKDVANLMGVSVQSVQRWDGEGRFIAKCTTKNRRYCTQDQLDEFWVRNQISSLLRMLSMRGFLGACFKSPMFFSLPTTYRSRCSNPSICSALGSVEPSFGVAP